MLTIFYDGKCPLCAAEMKSLAKFDTNNQLILEDLHADDFQQRFPHIDPIAADQVLHGQLDDGRVIKGLDVTCTAWKLVNKHSWLQILRWPVVRLFADKAYLFFARYRHPISAFVSGKKRCESCQTDRCDL